MILPFLRAVLSIRPSPENLDSYGAERHGSQSSTPGKRLHLFGISTYSITSSSNWPNESMFGLELEYVSSPNNGHPSRMPFESHSGTWSFDQADPRQMSGHGCVDGLVRAPFELTQPDQEHTGDNLRV